MEVNLEHQNIKLIKNIRILSSCYKDQFLSKLNINGSL